MSTELEKALYEHEQKLTRRRLLELVVLGGAGYTLYTAGIVGRIVGSVGDYVGRRWRIIKAAVGENKGYLNLKILQIKIFILK